MAENVCLKKNFRKGTGKTPIKGRRFRDHKCLIKKKKKKKFLNQSETLRYFNISRQVQINSEFRRTGEKDKPLFGQAIGEGS